MRYTFRFNSPQTARQAARAIRRRGFKASQETIDVHVEAKNAHVVVRALWAWALRRGALPTWHLVDWE